MNYFQTCVTTYANARYTSKKMEYSNMNSTILVCCFFFNFSNEIFQCEMIINSKWQSTKFWSTTFMRFSFVLSVESIFLLPKSTSFWGFFPHKTDFLCQRYLGVDFRGFLIPNFRVNWKLILSLNFILTQSFLRVAFKSTNLNQIRLKYQF